VRQLKECKPRRSLKIDTADHPHSLTSLSPNTHAQRTHITNHIYTTPSNRSTAWNQEHPQHTPLTLHMLQGAHQHHLTATRSACDPHSCKSMEFELKRSVIQKKNRPEVHLEKNHHRFLFYFIFLAGNHRNKTTVKSPGND